MVAYIGMLWEGAINLAEPEELGLLGTGALRAGGCWTARQWWIICRKNKEDLPVHKQRKKTTHSLLICFLPSLFHSWRVLYI